MKKSIYKLLTIENGIILSADVLSYLSDKIATEEELVSFFSSFKARFNTSAITIDQVTEILEKKAEKKDFFHLNTFKFKHKDLGQTYENFRKKFSFSTTPISLLSEAVESIIFGVSYRNSLGSYCIEDDYDLIEIDYSAVKQDFYLFENMFVGARGIKVEGKFQISEFILLIPVTKKNSYLENRQPKILIFGKTDNIMEDIEKIIKEENPDLTVVFTDTNLSNKHENIVTVPCQNKIDALPVVSGQSSNPCTVDIFEGSFGLICSEVFKYREHGVFFNKNGMESLIRSYLSQFSLFPFSNFDCYLEYLPNIFVVTQNFHPIIQDIDDIKFISIPYFSKIKCYALLDFKHELYEIRFCAGSNI